MALDLAFSALTNAAGGLLFLLEGLAMLAIARKTRRGRIFGGLATVFGLNYIVTNLLIYDGGSPLPALANAASALLLATAAIIASRELLLPASRRARRWVFAVAGVALTLAVWQFATVLRFPHLLAAAGGLPPDLPGGIAATAFAIADGALLVLLVAGIAHLHVLPPEAARERRAILRFTMAFGLYTVFFLVQFGLRPFPPELEGATAMNFAGLCTSVLVVACLVALPAATPTEPQLARRAFFILACVALAAAAYAIVARVVGSEIGAYGIVRTFGAVLLAIAVLRHGLLDVPIPRSARRGARGTVALAALLIVTQVAQNFLSDQQSVLMGGVVSGAFLVAAYPIQRAMERVQDRGDGRAATADTAAVLTYRAAVRAALDDGSMTPREEEHLAEVAHHLRLSPLDALRLRREVERELAQRLD